MLKCKTIRCRKKHVCSDCGCDIQAGELASYYSRREGKFYNDVQIGIKYIRCYFHLTVDKCINSLNNQ